MDSPAKPGTVQSDNSRCTGNVRRIYGRRLDGYTPVTWTDSRQK
jgi:hypothetical protein